MRLVAVDHLENGAKKAAERFSRRQFWTGIAQLGTLLSVLTFAWVWGARDQGITDALVMAATRDSMLLVEIKDLALEITEHEEVDDVRTAAIVEGVAEMHETIAVIVAEQKIFRALYLPPRRQE